MLPAGRREIEKLSQQFVGEIRRKGTGAELSKRLYAVLVKPVPEAATASRFIIAPDGILDLLPFEALRDAQGEYLLKSRVISYVPSGPILNTLRHAEKQKPSPKPLLAIGDVEYENQGGSGRRITPPASKNRAVDLLKKTKALCLIPRALGVTQTFDPLVEIGKTVSVS